MKGYYDIMKKILSVSGLVLSDGDMYLSKEEKESITKDFKKNEMDIFFLENQGIKNSIFDGIEIMLNNNLFNMLVGGLLLPAAYDTLKNGLTFIIKKISNSNIMLLRANEKPEPIKIVIKIQTNVGYIMASIDQELSSDEVEKYINGLIEAYKIASSTSSSDRKNQYFIVDRKTDTELEILILSDYLKKHKNI